MPHDPIQHMIPVLSAVLEAQEKERSATLILAGFGKLLPETMAQVDELMPIFGQVADLLFAIALHNNALSGTLITAPICEIANDIGDSDDGGVVEEAHGKVNSFFATLNLGGLVDNFPGLFETRHVDRLIDICEAIEAERLMRPRPHGDPYEALIDIAEFNPAIFNTKQINRLWAKRDNAPSADFTEERPYDLILRTLAKKELQTEALLRVRRLMPNRPADTSGIVVAFKPVSR